MDHIKTIKFKWNNDEYDIKLSLVGNNLIEADFVAEGFLNDKLVYKAVPTNAFKAIIESMETGEHPLKEIITLIKYNIKQGFNKV